MLAKIIVHFCHDIGVYDFLLFLLLLQRLLFIEMVNSTACTNAPRFMFNIFHEAIVYGEAVAMSGIIVALLTFRLPLFHTSRCS